jgi:hypothetical protein
MKVIGFVSKYKKLFIFRAVLFHHASDPLEDGSPRISVRPCANG